MTGISRRAFGLGVGASLLGAPAILRAQQAFRDYPFRLGIAAGDPTPDGFVLWTRLAPDPLAPHGGMPIAPIDVEWSVWAEPTLKTVVASGTATARPELAHAVHVEVSGLAPDRPYWYRFRVGRERTMIGRARTAPPLGARLASLRFGVAGCQQYEDGFYTAYRHLADEEVAFVYHYGDYIYEAREQPVRLTREGWQRPYVRSNVGGECISLDDYRQRYAQYKMDQDLQRAHAAAPWFVTFDDHEVANDWTGFDTPGKTPAELFAFRRAAAFQAWYEHMPVRRTALPRGPDVQMFRRARYGDLLDAYLLDTRQFRSPQPCGGGFAPDCEGTRDSKAVVLGTAQEAWLAAGLKERAARWTGILQQVMMMRLDRRVDADATSPVRNLDSWAGYLTPRERMLELLRRRGDCVVLTGDEHQNFAGELRTRDGAGDVAAVEFVATSISSGGNGSDKRAGADRIMAASRELKFSNDQRGYLVCDLDRARWETRFRVVDQVEQPGGTISTREVLNVPAGRAVIEG